MKTVDVGKSHLCDPLCMCHFFDPGGTGSAERECLCPRWSLLQILLWNYCCQSEAGAQEPFNHPHHPRLKVQTYCWLKRSQFTSGLWAVSPKRKFWHTVSRLRGICFVSRVCVCRWAPGMHLYDQCCNKHPCTWALKVDAFVSLE